MRYVIKSGIVFLPEEERTLAHIKSMRGRAAKTICLADNEMQYQTDINVMDAPPEKSGDVRYRVYTLKKDSGEVLMEAHPGYAREDDPDMVGWPICRAPKVDHAEVWIAGNRYTLVMHNSQNYTLQDESGASVLQMMHRGIAGGWVINTTELFPVPVFCGVFLFCRYIEQENEFIVV